MRLSALNFSEKPMATTAADVLINGLLDWGVDTVFGIPGDGINGIMEALRQRQDDIRFIQVRHEESAAFMACGYAKFTGRLGVCLATSGPGGVHLLNGLYDAKLDHQPVLAITGLQFHDLIGTHTQQDVALDKLFIDVAVYNERIMGATNVENVVDLACRRLWRITACLTSLSLSISRNKSLRRNSGPRETFPIILRTSMRRFRRCLRTPVCNAPRRFSMPGRRS